MTTFKHALGAGVSLERIKELAVIGMFADDDLLESLVLKGGNALDLIYKISARASVDIDFSMQGDFPEGLDAFAKRVEASLLRAYAEEGLRAFDFKVQERPRNLQAGSAQLKNFWGGYAIEFKLIHKALFEQNAGNIEGLRKYAIDLGEGPKFLIDVSCYEFLDGKVEHNFQGYSVFVYSPAMILAEKLRALCQQLPEYGPIIERNRPGSSRARDFIDIYILATAANVDMRTDDHRRLLANVFKAKHVPLNFLELIEAQKAFHAASFNAVKDSFKVGIPIKPFDLYFGFVIDLIASLQPFGDA